MLASLFWLTLLLLAYTFVGYPAWMALRARLRPRPVRRRPCTPSVAIVVVMHNEAGRVRDKLQTCLAQDYPADRLRVIVVSDGSTDDTPRLVAGHGDPRVRLLAFEQRRGKAACLNDAVAACDEDIIVFTDARQRLNREAVRCLVENFADLRVGAVSGELVFVDERQPSFGQGVDAYWRYEKMIRRSEAAVHSVPGATGALYALRRTAFRPIAAQTILDDVAIPMQACLSGLRVVFDGRAIAFDQPSQAVAQERRRKVRTLAGNFQILALMPALLVPWRNPIFLQYLSHKVLRLLAPWALLLLLALNGLLALDSTLYAGLLALQLAFYGLPAVAQLWPRLRAWKPARIVQAFVALNAFAVLGLVEFLTNRDAHRWSSAHGASASSGGQP